MRVSVLLLACVALCVVAVRSAVPSFPLKNSAVPGLRIPAIGLGTGAYGYIANGGYGGYPECFDESCGCGESASATPQTQDSHEHSDPGHSRG